MDASARHRPKIFEVFLMTFVLLLCVNSQQGAGDVWFSHNGTTYQNNSNVILEEIGEGDDDALLCKTNQTCCRSSDTGSHAIGHWYFPNGTRVPSSGNQWDFHRTRGQMVVRMNRRRGGEEGIYRCEIPDTFGFTQTLYIGVYSASTVSGGVWFSLRGTSYQNNSIVILEDIGEADNALLCMTNLTACCHQKDSTERSLGNWYFPNGSRVLSSDSQWDIYITRGQMVVPLHRRRGGVEGIYRCEIPDTFGFIQTIYIGVYSASTAAVLRGIPYRNNSIVILEDIGEGDDALLCITNLTACCRPPYTGETGPTVGDWYFPNGTRVPGSGAWWDFHRTRGQMVVLLHRRKGGVEGIYRCEIPDAIQTMHIGVYSASTAAALKGTTYQNNSIVILEDIGEDDDALLCITNQTACCRPPYTGDMVPRLGNWYFPNGTTVPSSGNQWDFHRTRGQMVVRMHRRRGGVEGIYRCEIPDAMNVTQTIYIGVYSASTASTTEANITVSNSIQPTNTFQRARATTTVINSSTQPTNTPQSDRATTIPVMIIAVAAVITLIVIATGVIILVVLIRRNGTKKSKGNELKLRSTGRQATLSADQPLYAVAHEHEEEIPSKSEELEEYLNEKSTQVPAKRTSAESEYALPRKSLKLFALSEPMFGEMESNPTYQSIDQCRVPPSYANLPQGIASGGIYSVPK